MKIDLNTSLKNNQTLKFANENELQTFFQIKYNLGQKMFYRNKNMYENLCIKYENNEDDETLEKIEKYEDRLKYFLKK